MFFLARLGTLVELFSAVALGVQEKNEKLQTQLRKYEETPLINQNADYVTSVHRTKEKLANYSVIKVRLKLASL